MDEKSILTINVVTPDGSVYENTTDLVICKTTVGEIGIMPNHLPLLASLAIDEVRVKVDDENFDEIAVSGGFMEFSDNTLSVVASKEKKLLMFLVRNVLSNVLKSVLKKLRTKIMTLIYVELKFPYVEL